MTRTFAMVMVLACLGIAGPIQGCGGGSSPPQDATDTGDDPTKSVQLAKFQVASSVVGQVDFVSGLPNMGGGTAPNSLEAPEGTIGSDGSFFVADTGNYRVLGFASLPASAGLSGDFVLGQPNFSSSTGGTSVLLMNEPAAVTAAGGRLAVADTWNNRILIWNSLPTTTATLPDVVVGQPSFNAGSASLSQSGLDLPFGVALVGNRLLVADTKHSRVLIWNAVPAASGAPADVVVGQPNFLLGSPLTSSSRMDSPRGVWSDGVRLVVADTGNDRVLIWNTLPTSNGQPADVVVGQPNFTTKGGAVGLQSLRGPRGVFATATQLVVADTGFHRVLVYEPFPTVNQPAATTVLGQGDFAHGRPNDDDQDGTIDPAGPTARTLDEPQAAVIVGNRLVVTDRGNSRVLVFDGS